MNVPTHCPLCNDPLLNDFKESLSEHITLYKQCKRRLDHKFFAMLDGNDELLIVCVETNLGKFYWNVKKQLTWMVSKSESKTVLPWFEPNIKSKSKFLSKLKTYALFS